MLLLQVEDARLRQLIGDRIKKARGKSKLTQEQVAKKIGGIDKTQISKWEHGHTAPSALQLLHLSEAVGERAETFIEGLVEPTWEQIALGLPTEAKAIVYDLANYLKDHPTPRPSVPEMSA